MNPMQERVEAWHRRFGAVVGDQPAIRRPELRAALIEEEARETCEAIRRGDLVEAIDGMCDVLYVVFGTAVEFGIDLEPFFAEVHRTNMLKVGGASREDGKVLKPEGWQPPRIAEILQRPDANLDDDLSRCAICGWPLGDEPAQCRRGDCSFRPRPRNLYSPVRAEKEMRGGESLA